MRKVIGAINMTLDGIGDHTASQPGEEIHQHYTDLLNEAGVILYGRTTFQLMGFWKTFLENPSDVKSMNDFALAMDKVPKVVFSRSLQTNNNGELNWHSARLSRKPLEEEVEELRTQPGNDIYVGSRSLILQLIDVNFLDELQLCIHPIIAGSGSYLFDGINHRRTLRLLKTKAFRDGAIILFYEPADRGSSP
jgi:dihydrofolate reductase